MYAFFFFSKKLEKYFPHCKWNMKNLRCFALNILNNFTQFYFHQYKSSNICNTYKNTLLYWTTLWITHKDTYTYTKRRKIHTKWRRKKADRQFSRIWLIETKKKKHFNAFIFESNRLSCVWMLKNLKSLYIFGILFSFFFLSAFSPKQNFFSQHLAVRRWWVMIIITWW